MNRVKQVLVVAFIGMAFMGAIPYDAVGQAPPAKKAPAVSCTPPHQMAVQDLDMRPDPVWFGQPIQQWFVTLRSDRNGECATRILIRDRDQLVGLEVEHVIKPGTHRYPVKVAPGYRFQGQDHCFLVVANIGGTPQPIDAAKKFCAKYGWTLK